MGKLVVGLTDEFYTNMFEKIVYKDAYTILPLLMRPKSKGEILLKSSNPYDAPMIYPNYFDNPEDLKTLVSTNLKRSVLYSIYILRRLKEQKLGIQYLKLKSLKIKMLLLTQP